MESTLAEFADRVGNGGGELDARRLPIYRALGRGELAEGRSLDALQAAYRLGGRVAWRRYVRVARRLSLSTDALARLAEAAFTHIEEIAAASVTAYARAQADAAGTLGRRRHRLLALLIAPAPLGSVALERAAQDAEWELPELVAAVALGPRGAEDPGGAAGGGGGRAGGAVTGSGTAGPEASPTARAPERGGEGAPPARKPLPEAVLADLDGPAPCLLVPDPDTRLADPRLRRLLHERSGVIGPVVPLAQAADSLRWARTLRENGGAGTGAGTEAGRPESGQLEAGPLEAGRHLTDLLLLADPALVRLMATRRLAPLAELTPKQRSRLAHTLLAHLQSPHGSAPELAARLAIHPQTARQRLHHLQRLFGPALTDPDARFELEAALRAELPGTTREYPTPCPR
ncbi:helix-turn-helix domain-containing protein [Streptomyces sp. NPDC059897]|uniref:helix-turn-helix domain-containing protein n=1 Tax=Streptomyces sp. NPDC059897 TaxID=3346994 RepID=UPI00366734FB